MPNLNITQLMEQAVTMKASDLHLSVAAPPIVRINTALSKVSGYEPMTLANIEYVLSQILNQQQKDIFEVNKEIDFSVALGDKARFRVNAFFQKGYPSIALRLIPFEIKSLEELGLPSIMASICTLTQGLVLVAGPTGSGKSTAIASMIQKINETRSEHILTIEDPVEYVFTNKLSLIEQREMYLDTHSWDVALKSVLRQDPNIVVIGEMRDYETMAAALTIAETGHLVFASLHTNSASQTVDRIVDSFPEEQQHQVRVQLAQILEAVLSLRLIKSASKGVAAAVEILLATSAVRSLIREGKTYQLDNVISTSANLGMISLEKSIAELISNKSIELEDGLKSTIKPDDLRRYLKGASSK